MKRQLFKVPSKHKGEKLGVVAVIPIRYSSTRFPGKALAPIQGKPLVQWVYERTSQLKALDEVLVATDDERILKAVEDFGGRALLTSPHHQSGTERVAEVAANLKAEVIVNVQGDEPLIRPEMIAQTIAPFMEGEDVSMASLKYPISSRGELEDPNVVKVVTDQHDYALYFSRFPIPYNRTNSEINLGVEGPYWKHIGLYVYRSEFLQRWGQLKPSPLEQLEQLEQLRVLENGYRIKVLPSAYNSWGVDTPADINHIHRVLQAGVK